jgi:hypothetical protein
LANSREIFLKLLDVSRGLDQAEMDIFISERDYEGLDRYIMLSLLGG